MKFHLLQLGVIATFLTCISSARADEGMWTFDNFPSATVKEKYGVDITPEWLARVQRSAVRLSTGCSASVVSAEGLVLSNHHCIRDCAQTLSTAKINYVENGFSAAQRSDEKLCPGMQAEILSDISDVTSRVSKASAGKTGEAFVRARDGEIAAIEKQNCTGKEAMYRCQVLTLYQGGIYKLYVYRKYSDVRLVAAPELAMAFFGGDPDNFNFPRYNLDYSFVRLYENNAPVATPDHLVWSAAPPKDGEVAFVAGNPGTTQRLMTAEQLESVRDFALPETLILYSELRGRLIRFSEEGDENARTAEGLLFGIENSFKRNRGEWGALVHSTLIAQKRQADKELRAQTEKNAALAKEIGDPWGDIARAQGDRKTLYHPYSFLESRAGLGSDLFRYARWLVRAGDERAKPNAERLPEFTDSQLALLQKRVLDARPVYPALEQLALEFWLSKLRENLTADAPGTKRFLAKDSPETLSKNLAQSRLGDPAFRKGLWDGGKAAITASNDPLIRYVVATDAASRAVRKEYENKVAGPTDRAAEKIAKARFAAYGTSAYPDASFSLRLSYGKVTGWMHDGRMVDPFTRFAGLWERATGQFPFNLPPRWVDARDKVNPDAVFDFVSNNDIAGGNSGSPVINAKGEVIGAVFDGNIESLGGTFGFDDTKNRTVSVSTDAITEALRKIYKADALVAELTGK